MFKVRTNVSQNYKEHVLRAEVWPSELPGQHSTKEDALVLYYEYYCPGCFTILDVEIAEKRSSSRSSDSSPSPNNSFSL
jgi:acetone carboxylase gamma subunit